MCAYSSAQSVYFCVGPPIAGAGECVPSHCALAGDWQQLCVCVSAGARRAACVRVLFVYTHVRTYMLCTQVNLLLQQQQLTGQLPTNATSDNPLSALLEAATSASAMAKAYAGVAGLGGDGGAALGGKRAVPPPVSVGQDSAEGQSSGEPTSKSRKGKGGGGDRDRGQDAAAEVCVCVCLSVCLSVFLCLGVCIWVCLDVSGCVLMH